MQTMLRDLRFGIRSLMKDKGFSMTVILTLALCIGANTAIFAIVHSVLLQPLPVPRAEEILVMGNQYPQAGAPRSTNSGAADYYDRLKEVTVFQQQAMFGVGDQTDRLERHTREDPRDGCYTLVIQAAGSRSGHRQGI